MRLSIVFIFLLISVYGSSQKRSKYTIYKMGRPDSFERNNAVKDVQSNWKVSFVALGSGVYSSNMDSIIDENKKTDIALKVKFGDNWRSELNKKADETLAIHKLIRELVKKEVSLESGELIEVDVKNKRKSIVKIFNQTGTKKEFTILYRYKYKSKANSLKLLSDKPELIDFSYPENGIEN